MADYQGIVEKFRQAMFEQHDPDAAAALYTDDATWTDPGLGQLRGKQAIRDGYAGLLKAFPDAKGQTNNVFGAENKIASELTFQGTHTGPLELGQGNVMQPTGKQVELKIGWVAELDENGLIKQDRSYYDVYTMLQQLGVVSSPSQAAAA